MLSSPVLNSGDPSANHPFLPIPSPAPQVLWVSGPHRTSLPGQEENAVPKAAFHGGGGLEGAALLWRRGSRLGGQGWHSPFNSGEGPEHLSMAAHSLSGGSHRSLPRNPGLTLVEGCLGRSQAPAPAGATAFLHHFKKPVSLRTSS